MLVCRFVGWFFLILAVAVAAFEAVTALLIGGYRVIPLGQLWLRLDPAGVDKVQSAIEHSAASAAWDVLAQPLLALPGWVVLGVPGLLFLLVCRFRNGRRAR